MINWKKWYIENLEGNELITDHVVWECINVDHWKGSPLKEKQVLLRNKDSGELISFDASLKFIKGFIDFGGWKIKKNDKGRN